MQLILPIVPWPSRLPLLHAACASSEQKPLTPTELHSVSKTNGFAVYQLKLVLPRPPDPCSLFPPIKQMPDPGLNLLGEQTRLRLRLHESAFVYCLLRSSGIYKTLVKRNT